MQGSHLLTELTGKINPPTKNSHATQPIK